jgi:hypothetical protein
MPYAPQNPFLPNNDPYPHYPDDWIALPPPAPPNAASPAPNLQPDASTLAISNRPPPQPLPLEAPWAHIPIGAATWDPPIFPDSFGQYQRPAPAPFNVPSLDGLGGLLAGLTRSQRTPSYPPLGLLTGLAHLQGPPADAPLGLLGVTINQQPPAAYASASRFSLFGTPTPDFSNQSPPLLGSLDDPSWSPPSASGIGGYSGPGREFAGSDAPTAASYASGSPSYLQPAPTEYQGGSAPYPYRGNDRLYHADPAWFASDQLPPPVFRNSLAQFPPTGNTPGDIPLSNITKGLPGSSNLRATNSAEQTDTSFAPDSRSLILPDPAGYQSGSPLSDVVLIADKKAKENQRNIDLFNERAFGVSPPLNSAAPRLVPPSQPRRGRQHLQYRLRRHNRRHRPPRREDPLRRLGNHHQVPPLLAGEIRTRSASSPGLADPVRKDQKPLRAKSGNSLRKIRVASRQLYVLLIKERKLQFAWTIRRTKMGLLISRSTTGGSQHT